MSRLFLSYSFTIIMGIIKCLIFIRFVDLIFNKKKIESIYKVLGVVSLILVDALSYIYLSEYGAWIAHTIFVLICLIYISVFYSNFIFDNIIISFAYFITFRFLYLTANLSTLAVLRYLEVPRYIFEYISTALVLFIAYCILTSNVVVKAMDCKKFSFDFKQFLTLLFFCLIGFFGLIFYNTPILLLIAAVCGVAIIIISSNVKIICEQRQSEILLTERNNFLEKQDKLIKEKEAERYKSYKKSLDVEQQIRRINHDLMHHFNVLLDYKDLPPGARNYINGLKGVVKQSDSFYDTGSSILDLILQEKCIESEKANIKFKVMGSFGKDPVFEPSSISVVFGNLLNNAFEACLKLPEDAYKTINLLFGEDEATNDIDIDLLNTANVKEIAMAENGNFKTTKEDKSLHGIGTGSVKKELERYGATISYKVEEDRFKTHIHLDGSKVRAIRAAAAK